MNSPVCAGIMGRMRTLVLILMIALLPLRTWAAEGMSVRMALEQVAAASGASPASMPEDCPMTGQGMVNTEGETGSAANAHCTSCHLCAAAACMPQMERAAGPAPAHAPERPPSRYLSADLTPDLRPPIS